MSEDSEDFWMDRESGVWLEESWLTCLFALKKWVCVHLVAMRFPGINIIPVITLSTTLLFVAF